LADIFRSPDMSGAAKAGWLLFVIVLPIIGVVVYLVARGGTMAEHSAARHAARANVGYGTYGGERAHAAYDDTEMRPYS